MKHLEIETLIRKFEGQLAERDVCEIDGHLADCSECAAEAGNLADFFAYAEQHVTDWVPQAVTASLLNIYERKPVTVPAKQSICSRIASLIFDDWQVALNERYSGLDTRQLLYIAGDYEIDLRLELIGEACRLAGQIFPEGAGAVAEISSPSHTATAATNELGEFAFDPVPQGIYDLRISINSEVLSIPDAPLQP